jgi:hypothetical protein
MRKTRNITHIVQTAIGGGYFAILVNQLNLQDLLMHCLERLLVVFAPNDEAVGKITPVNGEITPVNGGELLEDKGRLIAISSIT